MENLEIILIESIAGFAAGFKHGIYHDRNLVAGIELKELYSGDKEEFSKVKKDLNKKVGHVERTESFAAGAIVGLANLALTTNLQLYADGFFAVSISTYLGLQAGKHYSKFKRSRAKITPEQD